MTETELVKLMEAIEQHSKDMHYPSDRPCDTCRKISQATGKPFGCYEYQERRKEAKP